MHRAGGVLTIFTLSTILVAVSPRAIGQHQHSATNWIDGSATPEQIPDLDAYRLILVSLATSPSPTEDEKHFQAVHFKKIGVSASDQQTIIAILSRFQSDYESLISSYNEKATAAQARGEATDPTSLLRNIDLLVQSTRDTLKTTLTADGWVKFDGHVQSEKRNMKVSRRSGQ
jgi:hypothetical protein